ncbi:MAG: hypothetical protein QOE77_2281 [Blastocatellia bacterium]|jgi:hypothetical protein|nr:hypothetical protein [Blastocatellia bacterium]
MSPNSFQQSPQVSPVAPKPRKTRWETLKKVTCSELFPAREGTDTQSPLD